MTRAVRLMMLVVVWLALWSEISVANVMGGLTLGTAIVVLFDTWNVGRVNVRPVHVAKFALHFGYKLVQSSLVVARTVVMPRSRIDSGIVAVELNDCSDAVATLIADTISLTPGTLTLEVRRDPLTLFVHALDVRDVEQMQADIRRLEELAVRAFGPPAAVAALAADSTAPRRLQ
jgi:multicomponent Na+:H+ antiporter subunit E